METELKRKIFLEKLLVIEKKNILRLFSKYVGPGIRRKVLRSLFGGHIYLLFFLNKLDLLSTKNRTIKLFWGREIKSFINSSELFGLIMSKGALLDPSELKLTKFLIKNLKENDIFYDVGANYGFYTYLALEFCKEVNSFEPLPDVFENLRMNLEGDKKVFLNNMALSEQIGETFIYVGGAKFYTKEHTGGSTIITDKSYLNKLNPSRKILIKTITLDEYIKNHNKPTIIKLDVEGAESLVIKGGYEFFKNNSPIIAMEVWSGDGIKFSQESINLLTKLNYKPYFINENGDLLRIKPEEIYNCIERSLDNFVFQK
jgi:FkbM family methyltransferase